MPKTILDIGPLGRGKENLNLKREREILRIRKEPTFVFTSLTVKIMIITAWCYKTGTQQVIMSFVQTPPFEQ